MFFLSSAPLEDVHGGALPRPAHVVGEGQIHIALDLACPGLTAHLLPYLHHLGDAAADGEPDPADPVTDLVRQHQVVLGERGNRDLLASDQAIKAVRRVRRRELSRIGIADVLGRLDIDEVGTALSDLTEATLGAALTASIGAVARQREEAGKEPFPTRMAVVLMGRLGGRESGYGSDADVMFVHEPLPGSDDGEAAAAATAVATSLT